MSAPVTLLLDHVFAHEQSLADQVFMTQPLGQGRVQDYTWAQTTDQARRMAAHLRAQGLAPGARIAVLSKNCAHFIMAELAIWMAGGTTVAIFPTETAETVNYVLTHSGASLLFVGKSPAGYSRVIYVPVALANGKVKDSYGKKHTGVPVAWMALADPSQTEGKRLFQVYDISAVPTA